MVYDALHHENQSNMLMKQLFVPVLKKELKSYGLMI